MSKEAERFTLEALSTLADLSRRTVRYYIQQGLVARPEGAKRGSYYTHDHLDQILTIKKWQRAGLNLERIRELVSAPEDSEALPPERPKRPGDVSVRSHISLRPGIELVVEPSEAALTPEDVRTFARQTSALLDKLKKEKSK